MDNKDFDKILSEKLKETQSFEFMESDWENVLGRIEVPEKRKRRGGWLWLLGLGFLTMAGTSMYLGWTLNKTNQHLVELQDTMSGFKEIQRAQVVIVDTVYREVVLERGSSSASASASASSSSTATATSTSTSTASSNASLDIVMSPSSNLESEVNETSNRTARNEEQIMSTIISPATGLTSENNKATTKTSPISDVSNNLTTSEQLWLSSLDATLLPVKNHQKPVHIIQVPKPVKVKKCKKLAWKYLSVGVMGGASLSRSLDNNGDQPSNFVQADQESGGAISLQNKFGYDVGLLLNYQLTPNIQLTGGVSYQQINYSADLNNFDDGLQEVRAGYTFVDQLFDLEQLDTGVNVAEYTYVDNFQIRQRAFEYRLGANYVFRAAKKWRPYLGLSVSALSIMKQELWGQLPDEDSASYPNAAFKSNAEKLNQIDRSSSLRWNAIVPAVGFQLALSPKINWQMEGWYNQRLKKRSDQLDNLFGIRTGVTYRF